MELVQAPSHLKTNKLVDLKHEENLKLKKLQASRKSARIQKKGSLDIPTIADTESEPENEEEDESKAVNDSESE